MRSIVALLPRAALRQLVSTYGLDVADARKTEALQKAVLKGMKSAPGEWLGALPAATLKQLVVDADVESAQKTKAALVNALVEAAAPKAAARPASRQKKQADAKRNAEPKSKAAPTKKQGRASKAAKSAAAIAHKPIVVPAKAPSAGGRRKAATQAPGQATKAPASNGYAEEFEALASSLVGAAGSVGHRPDEADLAAGAPGTGPSAKPALIQAGARKSGAKASGRRTPKAAAQKTPSAPTEPADVQAADVAAADEGANEAEAAAPKHMLSWSDAVARAAKRGQSAATMIGQPAAAGPNESMSCPSCQARVEVQPCQIHTCQHSFVAKPGRKICAECMFERNNMSVETFHERLREDWLCLECNETVPRPQ